MNKVLTVAYMFPPIGGAGVQRNSKFVRYLPEFDYDPVVVTGPGEQNDRWTPTDRSLVRDIPVTTSVHRIAARPPDTTSRARSLAGRVLMLDSPQIRWWVDSTTTLATPLARECELIFASLVPYEIAPAAMRLARATGRPWVADLQDPWALDEMWLYPSAAHRRWDLRRMRRTLGTAAAIVMNTPEAAGRLLAAFPELAGRPVVSIPNGFDAADFAGAAPDRDPSTFRIVHTGYLHTDAGLRLQEVRWLRRMLGGWTGEIDILTRSHVYLLAALRRVVAEDSRAADDIELVLAGVLSDADRVVAQDSPVRVTMPGYVDHATSVGLLRTADLLFLPMHDLPPGVRAGLVPGKTYEYIASGSPILGAVPDGDARELLERVGTAGLCRPKDVEAMATEIRRNLERWRSGAEPPVLNATAAAPYERRALTGRLAQLFDQVRTNHTG
jgi:glycosyltransferase involved in cell wall biosynthesis